MLEITKLKTNLFGKEHFVQSFWWCSYSQCESSKCLLL